MKLLLSKARISFLFIAFLLMGMEGCPQSQQPLTERELGFADPSLIGIWEGALAEDYIQLFLGEGVTVNSDQYEVGLDETGGLRVVQYSSDGGVYVVYSGYTSMLYGRLYLNLKIVECPICDERLYELNGETCPYLILQYATAIPERLAGGFAEKAAAGAERALFVAMMDEDFVAAAIEDGLIETSAECLPCVWAGSCIDLEQEKLQRFVSEYDEQLYPQDSWDTYIEVPGIRGQ